MKKISIVFMAVFFAISCNEKKDAVTTTPDRVMDNLKGDVHQAIETPYKTDSTGKVGEMDSCCVSVTTYDSAGYFSKYTSKDSKGVVGFEQNISRYENGLFKEITMTDKGKPTGRITIQLDKDGKKYSTAQEYDSVGKVASFYKDFSQNEYNQLTGMKQYKPDSTLKSSQETKYDKYIFLESISRDSAGKEVSKSTVKLDDKNNQIENTTVNTMKSPATQKDSTTTKVTKYKYDSYDDQGNWTQRTEWDDKGKAVKVVKREITYYKK